MPNEHTHTCSACGAHRSNHRLLFFLNLVEETIGKLTRVIFNFSRWKIGRLAATFLEKVLYEVFYLLGIVKFSTDIKMAQSGRSKLIWEEARRRSIPIEQVVIWGNYIEYYRAHLHGKIFYFTSLPIPPSHDTSGYKWLDDKLLLSRKLAENHLPAPKTIKVFTWRKAKTAFRELQKPVIIKPNFGSRGQHTTTSIHSLRELRTAYLLAWQITPAILVQEHLRGDVYRATVINHQLVGFFQAGAPEITGDGLNTVEELIIKRNKTRPDRMSPIEVNEDLISFIGRAGYKLETIIPENITVNLSAKTGRMYGGRTREMLNQVHPKMHTIFEKAAQVVPGPLLGFDLIIEDPTKDPDNQTWGIIECNSLPFIDLHYFALEGTPINLAKNVWDLWDTRNK